MITLHLETRALRTDFKNNCLNDNDKMTLIEHEAM